MDYGGNGKYIGMLTHISRLKVLHGNIKWDFGY